MNIPLKENERLDDLQNGYHIIQNTRDFCYGIDAVLLSDFARVKKGEQALDLGTGTGIIPILLKAKTQGEHFTGLEIQEQSAEMAGRSVVYNHQNGRYQRSHCHLWQGFFFGSYLQSSVYAWQSRSDQSSSAQGNCTT